MKEMRFLLAFPPEPQRHEAVRTVPDPNAVRSNVPSLWLDRSTPSIDLPGYGILLGVAFSQGTFKRFEAAQAKVLARADISALVESLVHRFWGGYLAVLRNPADGSWFLLRDPSSLFPVYRYSAGDHVIIASDADLLGEGVSSDLCVDYEAVGSCLRQFETRTRRTCLENVEELTPGALCPLSRPNAAVHQIWHPRDYFPEDPSRGFDEAARELRDVSASVLASWSELFGGISVATSGGVDSSLICAGLSHNGQLFNCTTIATPDPSGDERGYARAVAAQFGVQIAERVFDPARFAPCRPASRGLPRPSRRSFLTVLDDLLGDTMKEIGANVIFDGNGGDNLFCFLHSSAPVVDRWRIAGLNPAVFQTLLDMCRVTGCSVPTMLMAAARRILSEKTRGSWLADTSFLASSAIPGKSEPLTPWTEDIEGRRTGKLDHLALIIHAQNQIHGLTAGLPRFSPLASQPLVQYCLGIPSWLWFKGGVNRSLARAAFASSLPASILARTSKAGPDSFIREAFAANTDTIRELLLDGLLASHYVIDRPAVEQALKIDYRFNDEPVVDRLLDLLETENWCRLWSR